nr:hypothetical protein CFP56_17916 [Quercus suber]
MAVGHFILGWLGVVDLSDGIFMLGNQWWIKMFLKSCVGILRIINLRPIFARHFKLACMPTTLLPPCGAPILLNLHYSF